ncbi:MAG: hypothetical protein ABGY75_07785 [Gemmataceae bacterium]
MTARLIADLLDRHAAALVLFARQRCDAAEDVVQEAFCKLAALPAPILDALKAGEITLEAAKCFTVAQDEALALDVLDRMRGQDVSAHRLKQLLQPEAIRDTKDLGDDAKKGLVAALDAFAKIFA